MQGQGPGSGPPLPMQTTHMLKLLRQQKHVDDVKIITLQIRHHAIRNHWVGVVANHAYLVVGCCSVKAPGKIRFLTVHRINTGDVVYQDTAHHVEVKDDRPKTNAVYLRDGCRLVDLFEILAMIGATPYRTLSHNCHCYANSVFNNFIWTNS